MTVNEGELRLNSYSNRRIIQIGIGGFGSRWIDIITRNSRWEYAALCDQSFERLITINSIVGLPSTKLVTSMQAAIDVAPEADTILISTPYFCHAEQAVMALEAGKNVLIEKPLTDNSLDAKRILEVATTAGKAFMVNEDYRFREGAKRLQEIVASGEIGNLEVIDLQYFVHHFFPKEDWRNKIKYPVLLENNTHQFDLLRYVTGKEVMQVSAKAFPTQSLSPWKYPSVVGWLTMEGGLHVTFSSSWAYKEMKTPWEGAWTIRGTNGSIRWDENGISTFKRDKYSRIEEIKSVVSLEAVLDEFTSALDDERVPSVDLKDNIKTLNIILGIIKASEQGTIVNINNN